MLEKLAHYEDVKRIDKFDERWYQVIHEGEEINLRSVTTFLESWPKGVALIKYFKSLGMNADYYFKQAGEIGSHLHLLVEKTLLGQSIDYYELPKMQMNTSIDLWERYLTWCEFWKTLNSSCDVSFDPALIEFITFNLKYEFAGTVDLPLTINGEDIIIDWKFGNYIGDTSEMQGSAYAISLSIQFEKQYKRVWLVNIPGKFINQNGWRITEVRESGMKNIEGITVSTSKNTIKQNFEDFLHCQAIHNRVNPKETPKYKNYPSQIDLDYIYKNEIISKGLCNGKDN